MKYLNYSMPIKIFISHSSDDKDIVHQVVEKLGKNGILVDEYVFETGERTEEEIKKIWSILFAYISVINE